MTKPAASGSRKKDSKSKKGKATAAAAAAAALEAAKAEKEAAAAAVTPATEAGEEEGEGGGGAQDSRWLVERVTQYRYRLMSVVSRVVPVVKDDKKKQKVAAAETSGGSAGATAAGAAAAATSGEAEGATEEGHLVLHVRAPTGAVKAAATAPGTGAAAAPSPPKSGGVPPKPSPVKKDGKKEAGGSKGKGKGKNGGGGGGGGGSAAVDVRNMMEMDDEQRGGGGRKGGGDEAAAGTSKGRGGNAEAGASAAAAVSDGRPQEGLGKEEEEVEEEEEVRKKEAREVEEEEEETWLMFNDFLVERTVLDDARGFGPDWKEPCVLVYRRVPTAAEDDEARRRAAAMTLSRKRLSITPSVFDIAPLSKNRPVSQVVRLPPDRLPRRGDIVAIDAEFVSLTVEESRLRGDGSKVVTKQGRQSLARVSALDGRLSHPGSEANAIVMMDDYVVQSEPVVDHLTRFSGITPEDLDPSTSRHNLHHMRTVYLRLRWLADAGCVFLGHGLDNDFRMCNLTLPPAQVIDTVHLWSLAGQRKISLRFLAHYLLNINIQGETHDSIEDARIALALYNKYRSHVSAGTFSTTLDALYKYGWEVNWKLDGGVSA